MTPAIGRYRLKLYLADLFGYLIKNMYVFSIIYLGLTWKCPRDYSLGSFSNTHRGKYE